MKRSDEDGGDAEQRQQRAQAVAEQHRPAERDLELVAQPRRVEEERPVVGRRTDVERVAVDEGLAIGGQDQPPIVGGAGAGAHHLGRFVGDRRRVERPARTGP